MVARVAARQEDRAHALERKLRPPSQAQPPVLQRDGENATDNNSDGCHQRQALVRPRSWAEKVGSPCRRTDQHQGNRSRKHEHMQRQESGQLVNAKGQHLGKAARTVDSQGLGDGPSHPGSVRHRRQLRQVGRHEEQREQRSSHQSQHSQSAEQERQYDEARDGVLEQDVAIPDENKMGGANQHKERQPPDEQHRAAGIRRQVIVLNGKAHAKKQGEQRERLQIDAGHQYRIKRAIEPGPAAVIRQEPLENRDPESGGDVDRHDPEQGDAAHHVDRGNAIGRRYGASMRGCVWLELGLYRLHCHLIFGATVRDLVHCTIRDEASRRMPHDMARRPRECRQCMRVVSRGSMPVRKNYLARLKCSNRDRLSLDVPEQCCGLCLPTLIQQRSAHAHGHLRRHFCIPRRLARIEPSVLEEAGPERGRRIGGGSGNCANPLGCRYGRCFGNAVAGAVGVAESAETPYDDCPRGLTSARRNLGNSETSETSKPSRKPSPPAP